MARWRHRHWAAVLQQQPSAGLARNSQPGRRGLVSLSPDITRVSLQSSKEGASDYPPPNSSGSELRLRASAGRNATAGSRCALLPTSCKPRCWRLGHPLLHSAWQHCCPALSRRLSRTAQQQPGAGVL